MRKYRSLIIIALLVALAVPIISNAEKVNPTINVSGDAEVWVAPDEVTVCAGIEIWGTDLDSVAAAVDHRAERILKLRHEFNIDNRHIQTDYINIAPHTKKIKGQNIEGYLVRNSITIILRNPSDFNSFMKAVIDAGANVIHNVQFRTLELKKHREQVRSLAIRAAREKAEKLSRELGQNIGKAINVREGHNYSGYRGYNYWWSRGYDRGRSQTSIQVGDYDIPDSEGSVAIGQIRVFASVNVVFELK